MKDLGYVDRWKALRLLFLRNRRATGDILEIEIQVLALNVPSPTLPLKLYTKPQSTRGHSLNMKELGYQKFSAHF